MEGSVDIGRLNQQSVIFDRSYEEIGVNPELEKEGELLELIN